MKIFITGSTGFIGKYVARALSQAGHDLMLLIREGRHLQLSEEADRNRINIIHGDLSDMPAWNKYFVDFQPDALVHTAWEGLPDYGIEMCRRNFDYGLHLFVMAAEAGCKTIISAGSCWEYIEKRGALNEDSAIDSSKIFPAFKNALRIAGEAIAKKYDIRFYWPRIFFVYGPGQRPTSLIPSIISSLLRGEPPDIKNPSNRNDYIYVEDVADAILKLIQKKPDRIIYNIGCGYSTSVLEILSIVSGMLGCEKDYAEDIKTICDIGDDFCADITNIKENTGWTPRISLTAGIKTTIQYFSGMQ